MTQTIICNLLDAFSVHFPLLLFDCAGTSQSKKLRKQKSVTHETRWERKFRSSNISIFQHYFFTCLSSCIFPACHSPSCGCLDSIMSLRSRLSSFVPLCREAALGTTAVASNQIRPISTDQVQVIFIFIVLIMTAIELLFFVSASPSSCLEPRSVLG